MKRRSIDALISESFPNPTTSPFATAGNNTDGLAAPASWRVPPKQVDLANGACKLFGASNIVRDLIGAGLILPIAGAFIGENVR